MKRVDVIESEYKIDLTGVRQHGFKNVKVQPVVAW
jgi:hypothetical protein